MANPNRGRRMPSGRLSQRAVSLGTNMASAFVLFGLMGFYIDRRRGGGVAATLGGVLLAAAYSGYEVWKLVQRMDKEEKESRKTDTGGTDE